MRNILTKIWHDKRGNSLIIAAAALPLLIGSAGLATDTIQWSLWKRQLQRAADSAAIAGVYDRVQSAGSTSGTSGAVTKDLSLNNHTGIALVATYPKVTFPANNGTNTNQVKVELAIQRPLSFSSMFMSNPPMIKTAATAASVPGSDDYCIVSLEKTNKTGIQGAGNASVQTDCGWITNSIANNAAAAQGSASITATVIAAAGGIAQSSNWNVGKYDPFVPALEDPYKDVNPDQNTLDSQCGTTLTQLTGTTGAGSFANPGCYSSINVGSNQKLTLNPGIYYLSGGGVNIQGELVATGGVTIVMTNKSTATNATIGSFDMNASGTLNIEAPTSGPYSGIAIYQDRRAVDTGGGGTNITSSSPNKINGNSSQKVVGALYFPNQQVTYNGNGTGGYACTQFVVRRIVFSGNNGSSVSQFTDDCPSKGIKKIEGGVRVRLVA